MKAQIKKTIKKIINNTYNKFLNYKNYRAEKIKIRDKRRQEILSKYKLTEEQMKQIDEFYEKNYGKKIPYDWHRYFSSYTGKFNVDYFPELLFIPELEGLMVKKEYGKVLSDKNLLPFFISGIEGVKTPKIHISCINGIYRNENMEFISKESAVKILYNIGKVFIKPTVESGSGVDCNVLNIKNGINEISGEKIENVLKKYNKDFNVQEIITNCDSIKNLHPDSLNTFRIITYCWNSKVYHVPVAMRIGRGKSYVDNAHQGGMFIYVDDDGNLGECAYTEFQDRFFEHPDTKIKFKGYKVPEAKKVIEVVEELQQRIPEAMMISWDATVDDKGNVIIIELNLKGQSIWFPQMASGKPAFGENTAEILQWMKKKRNNKGDIIL